MRGEGSLYRGPQDVHYTGPVKSRTVLSLDVNVGSWNGGTQKPVRRVDVDPNGDCDFMKPPGT